MIAGHYRPDGTLEAITVDYYEMDGASREAICDWVRQHQLDPGRVPVRCDIGFDPATEEWVFPVMVRGDGGIRLDPTTSEPMMRRVRRRAIAWIPRINGQLLHAA